MDFFAAVNDALTQNHPSVRTAGPSWEDIKEASDLTNLLDRIFAAKVVLCVFAPPTVPQPDVNSNQLEHFGAQTVAPPSQPDGLDSKTHLAETDDVKDFKRMEQKDCDMQIHERLFHKCVEASWFESCKNTSVFLPVVLENAESPRFIQSLLIAKFRKWPLDNSHLNTVKWNALIKSISKRL